MKQNLKSHKTRNAFVASLMAVILCVAMLVGTTFAWFTDSVTSGKNTITAGNLDINLQYKSDAQADFADVTTDTNVFMEDTLWEPGHVEYAVMKIQNLGTLALKYKFGISIASETGSTNVNNQAFMLSDYLKYSVIDGDQSALTRDAMVEAAGAGTALGTAYGTSGTMTAGQDDKIVTLVVWMPTTVGNEANYKLGAAVPQIDLGVTLTATQLENESDSFDNTYDANATYPVLAPIINESKSASPAADGAEVVIESSVGKSTVPAASETGHIQIKTSEKTTDPTVTKNEYAMAAGSSLTRNFETTDSTADSVTYDISYVYTETVGEATTSYDVSEFAGVVTNEINLSTGLKEVKVTHTHGTETTAMTEATAAADEGKDGYYKYDSSTGKLTIWSSKYSSFKVSYASDYAAAINGQGYATIADALAAASAGNVITLLKDTTAAVTISKSVTINGDGKKIAVADGNAITVSADGVTLNNVLAESVNGIALVAADGAENLTVSKGSYKTATTDNVGKQGEGAMRFLGNNGNISVTGASMLGGLHVLNYASGTVTVSENTFAVDSSLAERTDIVCGILVYGSGASTLATSGATYLAGNTFSESEANYKVLIQDDNWKTVYSDKAVASTGGFVYDSLEAAITGAVENGTVDMLKDVTLTSTVTVSKAVTINLNSKTVTGKDTYLVAGSGYTKTVSETTIKFEMDIDGYQELADGTKVPLIEGEDYTVTNGVFKAIATSTKYSGKVVLPCKGITNIRSISYPGDPNTNPLSGNDDLTEIVIQEGITKITAYTFCNDTNLEKVTFPSTLTTLGWMSFQGCDKLDNVVIPEGITKIESGVFMSCDSLKNITIPSTCTTFENYAFSYTKGMTNLDWIPNTVTSIGDDMFQDCTFVTAKVPNGITELPKGFFSECRQLTTVYIGTNITKFCADSFRNNDSLTDIYYAGTEEQWNAITNVSIVPSGCTVHYNSEF